MAAFRVLPAILQQQRSYHHCSHASKIAIEAAQRRRKRHLLATIKARFLRIRAPGIPRRQRAFCGGCLPQHRAAVTRSGGPFKKRRISIGALDVGRAPQSTAAVLFLTRNKGGIQPLCTERRPVDFLYLLLWPSSAAATPKFGGSITVNLPMAMVYRPAVSGPAVLRLRIGLAPLMALTAHCGPIRTNRPSSAKLLPRGEPETAPGAMGRHRQEYAFRLLPDGATVTAIAEVLWRCR